MVYFELPQWHICTECGETVEAGDQIPDLWYVQRNGDSWSLYCPCITECGMDHVQGYARSGVTTTFPTAHHFSLWTGYYNDEWTKKYYQPTLDDALKEQEKENRERYGLNNPEWFLYPEEDE